jgi:hypothetical protein
MNAQTSSMPAPTSSLNHRLKTPISVRGGHFYMNAVTSLAAGVPSGRASRDNWDGRLIFVPLHCSDSEIMSQHRTKNVPSTTQILPCLQSTSPESNEKEGKETPVRRPSIPTPLERPKARPREKSGYRSSPLSIQPRPWRANDRYLLQVGRE